jgi:hypothetical protein
MNNIGPACGRLMSDSINFLTDLTKDSANIPSKTESIKQLRDMKILSIAYRALGLFAAVAALAVAGASFSFIVADPAGTVLLLVTAAALTVLAHDLIVMGSDQADFVRTTEKARNAEVANLERVESTIMAFWKSVKGIKVGKINFCTRTWCVRGINFSTSSEA